MVRLRSLLGLVVLVGCASNAASGERPDGGGPSIDIVQEHGPSDRDSDGLCDETERQAGTLLGEEDTDGDGLVDLAELANGFSPRRSASPAEDQVARLQAAPGASIVFPARLTVVGDGQGLVGSFEAVPTLYDLRRSAADYFVGGEAVSADPGENVRGVDQESQRFGLVVGETRLGFELRFAYREEPERDCIGAYPFRYSLKSDAGETLQQRLYLLLVEPPGGESGFCLPDECI